MNRIRALMWCISTIRIRRLARKVWGPDAPADFDDIAALAVVDQVVSRQDLMDASLRGIARRNGLAEPTR